MATRLATFAFLLTALSACPLSAQNAPRATRVQRSATPIPRDKQERALLQRVESAPASDREPKFDDQNARDTRQHLYELLRQYPPSLGEVLRYDPTLLTNQTYLTPYPTLAAFLAQHPEVAHNPGYFVGEYRENQGQNDPHRQEIQLIEGVLAGLAVLTGFITFISVVGWLLKSVIDYRRWLRQSKVQTEVHTKLLDRLTSNEDLLAYIQSSPGRRFLESAPLPIDPAARPINAPVGRILWSIQAGVVVAMGGLGLLFVSSRLSTGTPGLGELAILMYVVGIVALALGGGFVISAIVAYGISRRLGLFDTAPLTPHA